MSYLTRSIVLESWNRKSQACILRSGKLQDGAASQSPVPFIDLCLLFFSHGKREQNAYQLKHLSIFVQFLTKFFWLYTLLSSLAKKCVRNVNGGSPFHSFKTEKFLGGLNSSSR